MGRQAKPTHLKLIEGNPGKRALNEREPKPTGGARAPTLMTPGAKKVWPKLVAAMPPGVFSAADSYILASYCEAVSQHQLATKMISETPPTIEGSTGQTKISPWFAMQREAATQIAALGAKLGLDPISRQNISTSTGQADDESGLIY